MDEEFDEGCGEFLGRVPSSLDKEGLRKILGLTMNVVSKLLQYNVSKASSGGPCVFQRVDTSGENYCSAAELSSAFVFSDPNGDLVDIVFRCPYVGRIRSVKGVTVEGDEKFYFPCFNVLESLDDKL